MRCAEREAICSRIVGFRDARDFRFRIRETFAQFLCERHAALELRNPLLEVDMISLEPLRDRLKLLKLLPKPLLCFCFPSHILAVSTD